MSLTHMPQAHPNTNASDVGMCTPGQCSLGPRHLVPATNLCGCTGSRAPPWGTGSSAHSRSWPPRACPESSQGPGVEQEEAAGEDGAGTSRFG